MTGSRNSKSESVMSLVTWINDRAARRDFSRETPSSRMNGACKRIMDACARLWITIRAYLSSGIAPPTWWRGRSVVVKRMILCSNVLKFSEKAPDASDPDDGSGEISVVKVAFVDGDSRGLQLDESLFAPSNKADAFTRKAAVENPLSEFDCACCTKKARMVGEPPVISRSPWVE